MFQINNDMNRGFTFVSLTMTKHFQSLGKQVDKWFNDNGFIETHTKFQICTTLEYTKLSVDQFCEFFKRISEYFDEKDTYEMMQHAHINFDEDKANYYRVLESISQLLKFKLLSDIITFLQTDTKPESQQDSKELPSSTPITSNTQPPQLTPVSPPKSTPPPQPQTQPQPATVKSIEETENNKLQLIKCGNKNPDFSKLYKILERAADQGDEATIKFAVDEKYTEMRFEFGNGRDVVLQAALNGNLHLIQMLNKFGANMKTKDKEFYTILHLFCLKGNLEGVIWSVDYVDINGKKNDQWTPLHIAACTNNAKICEFLLSLPNIEKNALNNHKKTPLDVATAEHCKEAIKVLKKYGCK